MTSTVKNVRASHFKNILFISMALNTIMNVVVITSVSYAYQYSGLLFSIVFFFGLIGLSLSKLGVHPSLNAKVFLLCLIPEFLNLLALDQENLAFIALAASAIGLAISPTVNHGAVKWLSFLAVGALSLAKLTELGTRFEDLLTQSAGFLALLAFSTLVVLHVFSQQNVRKTEFKDELIDLDDYQTNLKFWLDPNFKYRLKLDDGDFLTKRLLEPLEASYPFLRKNAHKGLSERYPLIQIITKEAVPFLKAGNVQISATEEEKFKLYNKLNALEYTWYTNKNDSSSFAIAPVKMNSFLASESFEPVTFDVTIEEESPTEILEITTSQLINNVEMDPAKQEHSSVLEPQVNGNSDPEVATPLTEKSDSTPNLVDVAFRAKRTFTPTGGRPLNRLRKINPEGGSTDFQWNVPSK
jgi:hypothetical protein